MRIWFIFCNDKNNTEIIANTLIMIIIYILSDLKEMMDYKKLPGSTGVKDLESNCGLI